MKANLPARSLFESCKTEYARLSRELHGRGLDASYINKTRQELSESKNGRVLLIAEAYHPTGLALGCPLPGEHQEMRLFRLACLVEAWLSRHVASGEPTFAYVPPACYHITVVNRTHFEVGAVENLQPGEKVAVDEIVASLNIKSIQVISHGLLLTHSGRLMLKCFPTDDAVLHLRRTLTHAMPQLAIHVPRLVHVKLGHLMVPLSGDQLMEFVTWLRKIELHASYALIFNDLYTPQGRIKL